MRDHLFKYDRVLADAMKPLTGLNSRQGIYQQVIDRFATGQASHKDCEDLRVAVDMVQLQLKHSVQSLNDLETKVNESVSEYLRTTKQDWLRQQGGGSLSVIDEALFKQLEVFHQLLLESLFLKRFNTIGCKMKIYQERLRELNFLELLLAFRDENAEADDFEL